MPRACLSGTCRTSSDKGCACRSGGLAYPFARHQEDGEGEMPNLRRDSMNREDVRETIRPAMRRSRRGPMRGLGWLVALWAGGMTTAAWAGPTLPKPTNLSAVAVSSGQVNVEWTDASSGANQEEGFQVNRATNRRWGLLAIVGPNVTSYVDTDVEPDTNYEYSVRALGEPGNSNWSDIRKAKTLAAAQNPPQAPANLVATAVASGQVDLAWPDLSSDETGFRIERRSGAGGFAEIAALLANGGGEVIYSDMSVDPATAYTYRVIATNPQGESAPSNPTRTGSISTS